MKSPDFYAEGDSWKKVIEEAELDGIEKGKKEERERILEVIQSWKEDICMCSEEEGVCDSCNDIGDLNKKIQEEK